MDRDPAQHDAIASEPRRRIRRSLSWLVAGRLATGLLGIASVSLIARHLTVAELGVWTWALAVLNTVAALAAVGGPAVATADIARDPARAGATLGNLFAVRATGALVGAFALGIVGLFENATGRLALAFAIPLLLLSPFASVESSFQASQRMRIPVTSRVVSRAAFVAALASLSALGALTLTTTLAAFAGSVLLERTILLAGGRNLVRMVLPSGVAAPAAFAARAFPQGLATLFALVYFHADTLMLRAMSGDTETGIYGAAYRLFAFAIVAPAMLAGPLLPELARDRRTLRRLYPSIWRQAVTLGAVVAVGGILLSPTVIEGLYGPERYEASAPILAWLGGAFAAVCVGTVAGTALVAIGAHGTWAWITGVGLVANLALNAFLIPEYGAQGAAAATVATESLVAVWGTIAVARVAGTAPLGSQPPS